jgi:parallel beta-helix repeat protein
MSKYIALNILPSPIDAAKALRHKSSHYFSSHMLPSASQHNTGPSFSQPNIAYHANCINYNPPTRTITVSCSSARLIDIDHQIHDSNILAKQSPAGTWLLNANIVIAKEATFHIDSTDTKWLKIVSDQAIALGIICSLNCYNVFIENNQIYNNGGAGIMFSRNMSNSVARNNIIFNEVKGILVSQSHYNKIYNNTISDSQYGIDVMFGSSGNIFYSNVVKNSSHGLVLDSTSNKSNNTFYNNQFINSHSVISRHNKKPSLGSAKNRGVRSNF